MKSVKACCDKEWHLLIRMEKDGELVEKHVPWECRSWRHEGECRMWKASQDFARLAQAIKDGGPWTYVVLTFAQSDWPDKFAQYKSGLSIWAKLRKRISREWGKFKYIQTWERHLEGGAHVNVVIDNVDIYNSAIEDFRTFRNWLEPNAVEVGFGFRTWVEPVIGDDGMAGYLTKLAIELTGAEGKSQVPIDAPPHFRRIRSSKGTIPRKAKSDLTGRMVFTSLEAWLERIAADKGATPSIQTNASGCPIVEAPGVDCAAS